MPQNRDIQPDRPTAWPDTMWPLDLDVLDGLPYELRPGDEELTSLQYPWEFLTLMNGMRQRVIPQLVAERGQDGTLNAESVDFKNRTLTHIEGPVWFGDGVTVYPHTFISGPAYIGGDVGTHAIVRGSIIVGGSQEGLSVGGRCDIKASYMAAFAETSHTNHVLDSVLGPQANLGVGSDTTNQLETLDPVQVTVEGRKIDSGLDSLGTIIGRGARINGGCLIMPGKFIGRHSRVDPHMVVFSHVADRQRLLGQVIAQRYEDI